MTSQAKAPQTNSSSDSRGQANQILDVIMAFARLDFSHKITLSGKENDLLDAISGGVNMLGEELQTSTVSLKEKEQLLKEIHHRVKNNLQIVSSLLNLQSENVEDQRFLALIRESRNRIYSMALVHEMLYASRDLSHIRIQEYIRRLGQNIHESFLKPNREIEFVYEINAELAFDIDRMIPIGLILNEVISNANKYAFPDRDGTITISLQYLENEYYLSITDNGVGLPPDFDIGRNANLGMQLIFMLAEQLEGLAILLPQKTGTGFLICFPK